MTTSWRFCGRRTATKATKATNKMSSNSETMPRSGSSGHRLTGLFAATRATPISTSVVDADSRLAFATEETGWPKDHHQEEQDEKEHLSDGWRDVIAADRLNDANANAPKQRAFDAAHPTEHHDHECDQHEVESPSRKDREQRDHHAGGETDQG